MEVHQREQEEQQATCPTDILNKTANKDTLGKLAPLAATAVGCTQKSHICLQEASGDNNTTTNVTEQGREGSEESEVAVTGSNKGGHEGLPHASLPEEVSNKAEEEDLLNTSCNFRNRRHLRNALARGKKIEQQLSLFGIVTEIHKKQQEEQQETQLHNLSSSFNLLAANPASTKSVDAADHFCGPLGTGSTSNALTAGSPLRDEMLRKVIPMTGETNGSAATLNPQRPTALHAAALLMSATQLSSALHHKTNQASAFVAADEVKMHATTQAYAQVIARAQAQKHAEAQAKAHSQAAAARAQAFVLAQAQAIEAGLNLMIVQFGSACRSRTNDADHSACTALLMDKSLKILKVESLYIAKQTPVRAEYLVRFIFAVLSLHSIKATGLMLSTSCACCNL